MAGTHEEAPGDGMRTLLYALVDPRDNQWRYIGKTSLELKVRLAGHIRKAKLRRNHRERWLMSLHDAGVVPLCEELDCVVGSGASEERQLIAFANLMGMRLVNATAGGEGALGYRHTAATKAKLRLMRLGTSASGETKAKMSKTRMGKKMPPFTAEHRRRISEARRGRTFGPRGPYAKK